MRSFKKLFNQKHGLRSVSVTLARPNASLAHAVRETLKLKHDPEVFIEKELLGGAIVSIDDEMVIDGSVRTRIQKLFNAKL
ncbi:MAG: F0F1 ATP synthase subunit delta, partial [Candidatus Sungbacteria bacterium]|nr:F0F1 ATP synthase subunit delta [Candidatus Sungbacteria bacterium]